MIARIEILAEKKLIGNRLEMSFANNKTGQLWKSFMPRRKEIINTLGTDLYCLQVYSPFHDFINFNPNAIFEKWAAVEVNNFDNIPEGMQAFTLQGGLYAVFIHKGAAITGPQTFQYIFGTWLPNSEYDLDHRVHFEILGDKYINDDPNSEEEIWIPIKLKLTLP